MKPYYLDHVVRQLSDTLLGALRAQGEDVAVYAFSDHAQRVKGLEDVEQLPFGDSTMLDKALDRAVEDGIEIVWMITDNIQDAPGSTDTGDTEQFYKELRSDAVEKVTIFPLRQPPGRPGLVIYALLKKDGDSDLYERELAGFHGRAAGVLRTDALRMKPLDRDTVGISWVRANVNPRTSLITYDTGKAVREVIEVKFKSKFDHIEITDSSVEVAKREATFGKDSLIYPEKQNIDISPRTVERLGPGDETEQVYRIDVDLGKLKLRNDLASLWKAAWVKSSEDATLQLGFVIQVPQKNFRLRPRFLQQFNAATLQDAKNTGKVYAIDLLPSLMSEAVTAVQVTSPVVFRVRYPSYPTFLWLAMFGLFGLLIIGLFVAVKRATAMALRRSWDIEARTQPGVSLDGSIENGNVLVQREIVGRVEHATFVPATGTRIVQPPVAQMRLSDGQEVTVEARSRLVVLRFKTKRSPATTTAPAAAPPRRRI
jgi:hypothetical protein